MTLEEIDNNFTYTETITHLTFRSKNNIEIDNIKLLLKEEYIEKLEYIEYLGTRYNSLENFKDENVNIYQLNNIKIYILKKKNHFLDILKFLDLSNLSILDGKIKSLFKEKCFNIICNNCETLYLANNMGVNIDFVEENDRLDPHLNLENLANNQYQSMIIKLNCHLILNKLFDKEYRLNSAGEFKINSLNSHGNFNLITDNTLFSFYENLVKLHKFVFHDDKIISEDNKIILTSLLKRNENLNKDIVTKIDSVIKDIETASSYYLRDSIKYYIDTKTEITKEIQDNFKNLMAIQKSLYNEISGVLLGYAGILTTWVYKLLFQEKPMFSLHESTLINVIAIIALYCFYTDKLDSLSLPIESIKLQTENLDKTIKSMKIQDTIVIKTMDAHSKMQDFIDKRIKIYFNILYVIALSMLLILIHIIMFKF